MEAAHDCTKKDLVNVQTSAGYMGSYIQSISSKMESNILSFMINSYKFSKNSRSRSEDGYPVPSD